MKTFFILSILLLSALGYSQPDSLTQKSKRTISILTGTHSFSPLRMESNPSFDFIATQRQSFEFGLRFSRAFKCNNRFFMCYGVSFINSPSYFQIGFDSNRYYPHFNSDTSGLEKYSISSSGVSENNVSLSLQLGYHIVRNSKTNVSLASGLTGITNLSRGQSIWGWNFPQTDYSDFIVFFQQGNNQFMGMFYGMLNNVCISRNIQRFTLGLNLVHHFSFTDFVVRENNKIYFLSNTAYATRASFYQRFNYYGLNFQIGYSF